MKKINSTKEVLRESEERFRATFEQAAVGIAHVNPNGQFIRVNQRFCEIVKYLREEMLSMTFQEITHADDLDKDLKLLREMLKGELKTYSWEKRYICKDSSEVWVNLTVSLVKNQSNEPKYFISVIEDITSRKVIENALKKSESRYRNIIENTTDVIIVTGFDGKHIYVSPLYKDLFGRTPDQINKSLINYIHPDDQLILRDNYIKSFESKCAQAPDQEFEVRVQHQNGNFIWVSSITKNYYNEEGNVVGLITSIRDIRKRKEAEEKLKESEKKYRSIFENSPVALMDQDFSEMKKYVDHLKATGIKDFNKFFEYYPEEVVKCISKVKVIDVNKKTMEIYKVNSKEALISRMNDLGEALENKMTEEILLDNKREILALINGDTLYESEISSTTSLGDFLYLYAKTSLVSGFESTWSNVIVSLLDITDQKLMEESLKESEKKYRHLFESSPYFIGLIDENGTLVDCNSSINSFLSMRKREDVINKPITEILSILEKNKELIPLMKKLFQEAYSNDQGKSYEFKLHRSTGGYLWLKAEGSKVEINNKILLQFLVQDITSRKMIEEDLKESELKFRTIAEQSFMGIIVIQDGVFKYFNQRAADINGYTVEEINKWEPYEFMKLIHPDDNDFVLDQAKKKQKGDNNVVNRYIYRLIKKSGEVAWMDNYSKTINFDGRPADLVMTEDITKKIISEQKLKESELKFRKIFEANPSGMHLYDLNMEGDLIFKGANDAADKILKIDNSLNIGKTLEEAFPLLVETDIPTKYRMVASEGKTLKLEYFDYRSDQINGIYKIYAFQTAPRSMVSSFIDITDRIEAEQRLKEMNRLKSELLRRASHELRTPLTSINGAVELLLTVYKNDFNEKTEQFLNIIKNGGKRLENLIKDLLNVSRLQSQIVDIKKRRENIVQLLVDSIEEIDIFATEREINIIFSQKESIYINVDKNKILQVFVNILMNAVKYTPPKGEVSIKIREPTENSVDIIIKDTGIGFTEEEMKNLFTQFGKIERFGQGLEVDTEGSGLGLYISKELVELHSGKIWVESEGKNKGSAFIIRLPKF